MRSECESSMNGSHTHRTFDNEQAALHEIARACGDFAEPSHGLEPSTPSLPCAPKRLRWVATGCGSACLSGFEGRPICHRLRPLGSINAPCRGHAIPEDQTAATLIYDGDRVGGGRAVAVRPPAAGCRLPLRNGLSRRSQEGIGVGGLEKVECLGSGADAKVSASVPDVCPDCVRGEYE
jgi:hypothetical protein